MISLQMLVSPITRPRTLLASLSAERERICASRNLIVGERVSADLSHKRKSRQLQRMPDALARAADKSSTIASMLTGCFGRAIPVTLPAGFRAQTAIQVTTHLKKRNSDPRLPQPVMTAQIIYAGVSLKAEHTP